MDKVKRGGKKESRFAVCVENRGYAASLEVGKVYRVMADEAAARHGLIRVVDESGEDYLYPQQYFVVQFSEALEKAL